MISAVVGGTIWGAEEKTSNGKTFVTATISDSVYKGGDGDNKYERRRISIVLFGTSGERVLKMKQGSAVIASGQLSANVYTDRDGQPRVGLSLNNVSNIEYAPQNAQVAGSEISEAGDEDAVQPAPRPAQQQRTAAPNPFR